MKKYICLLSVIALASCKNSKYEVSGSIPNSGDSSYVYIKALNLNNTYQTLDSSLVINKQFKINGKWEKEATNAILVHKELPFSPKFILENGKIVLDIENIETQEYTLSGTVNNDTLNKLNQKNNANKNEIINHIVKANSNALSFDEKTKIFNDAIKIQNTVDLTTLNTIKNNINKPVGALLLEELILRKAISENVSQEIIGLMDDTNIYKARLQTFASGEIISSDIGKKLDLDQFNSQENPVKQNFNELLDEKNIVYFWNNSSENYKETLDILNKLTTNNLNQISVFTVYLGVNEKNWDLAIADYKNSFTNIYSNIFKNEFIKQFDLKTLPKIYIINKDGIIENVITKNENLKAYISNTNPKN